MDEAKTELVRGRLTKASRDMAAARLLAETRPAILDIGVYHCQQAAEKALKGFLVYWDLRVEKSHDVGLLVERAMQVEPAFNTWSDAGDRLTPFATAYRYPGLDEEPDMEEFEEALDDAECILGQVLSFLPREVHPVR
jgi:HEPN domain-containing protein